MNLYIDPGLRACGVALFEGPMLAAAGFPEGLDAKEASQNSEWGRSAIWEGMTSAVLVWLRMNGLLGHVDGVFVELPQVRKRGTQKEKKRGTDPNDLIQLAAVVGAATYALSVYNTTERRVWLPEEWKGQMTKEVMHPRAERVLSAAELALIPKLAASKLHNVMDAVCMGLVHQGRLKAGGRL